RSAAAGRPRGRAGGRIGLAALAARWAPQGARLRPLHRSVRGTVGQGQRLLRSPRPDGGDRRLAPRDCPVLYRQEPARGPLERFLGAVLYLRALPDRALRRRIRPVLYAQFPQRGARRTVAGVVPQLGKDRTDPLVG